MSQQTVAGWLKTFCRARRNHPDQFIIDEFGESWYLLLDCEAVEEPEQYPQTVGKCDIIVSGLFDADGHCVVDNANIDGICTFLIALGLERFSPKVQEAVKQRLLERYESNQAFKPLYADIVSGLLSAHYPIGIPPLGSKDGERVRFAEDVAKIMTYEVGRFETLLANLLAMSESLDLPTLLKETIDRSHGKGSVTYALAVNIGTVLEDLHKALHSNCRSTEVLEDAGRQTN